MKAKQQGFTLIELVVVIVILGILAATALPKLQSLDNDAKLAVLDGAIAAFKSQAVIDYGKLHTAATFASINADVSTNVQDASFSGTCAAGVATYTKGGATTPTQTFTVPSDICI